MRQNGRCTSVVKMSGSNDCFKDCNKDCDRDCNELTNPSARDCFVFLFSRIRNIMLYNVGDYKDRAIAEFPGCFYIYPAGSSLSTSSTQIIRVIYIYIYIYYPCFF